MHIRTALISGAALAMSLNVTARAAATTASAQLKAQNACVLKAMGNLPYFDADTENNPAGGISTTIHGWRPLVAFITVIPAQSKVTVGVYNGYYSVPIADIGMVDRRYLLDKNGEKALTRQDLDKAAAGALRCAGTLGLK